MLMLVLLLTLQFFVRPAKGLAANPCLDIATQNLAQGQWTLRRGFDVNWILQDMPSEVQSPVRFPILLNQIFEEPHQGGLREYTLQTSFTLDEDAAECSHNFFLEQSPEAWAVYVNGNPIHEEIAWNAEKTDLLHIRSFKNVRVPIPVKHLQVGTNRLTMRVLGHQPISPFNINNLNGLARYRYEIQPTIRPDDSQLNLRVTMVVVQMTVGAACLLIYFGLRMMRHILMFGLFFLTMATFYLLKYGFIDHWFMDARSRILAEYITIAWIFPILHLMVETYFYPDEPLSSSARAEIAIAIAIAFTLLYLVLPFPYAQQLIRIWQINSLLLVGITLRTVLHIVRAGVAEVYICILLVVFGFTATIIEIAQTAFNRSTADLGQIASIILMFILIWILIRRFLHNEGELIFLNKSLVAEREAILRFVPKQFLSFLGKKTIVDVKLGDQTYRQMNILFADIRSFTQFSETMTPQENFRFLNAYLERVGPIVRQHGGFIDKYIGDGIMALFPGEADQALAAAIAIQREVASLKDISLQFLKGKPLRVGIGLHSGELMLGMIGEEQRMEGTVISDAVNTAARLEDLCKEFQLSIVISENLRKSLRNPPEGMRPLGRIHVKGKKQTLAIYEVFEADESSVYDRKWQSLPIFQAITQSIEAEDKERVLELLDEYLAENPNDATARLLSERHRYQRAS
jgi:adenylate cyclase